MDSFFFNITDKSYKTTLLLKEKHSFVRRVDISNGVVFLEARLEKSIYAMALKNLDRFVMMVMVKKGMMKIVDHIVSKNHLVFEGEIALFCSSRQDIELEFYNQTEIFVLFISDFFLKRYLSAVAGEPIDFLYTKIQDEVSLECVNIQPMDALSLYSIEKLLSLSSDESMMSIRAEHRVVEFMIHRFSLLDIYNESIPKEELALALCAKDVLLQDFISPPTIEVIAHRCATNTSKLKKVFKKVYQITLHGYVQKLRLEEANILLKEENMTIGEIANRVGYKHQGHFSKLFFATYGVYPKELMKG